MTEACFSKIIEPIVNRNFGNNFHNHNGPNQIQHIHKNTCRQYQYISFQRSKNFSPPYLKVKCIGCGIGRNKVIEVLMHHGEKKKSFQRSFIYLLKGNNITYTLEKLQEWFNK